MANAADDLKAAHNRVMREWLDIPVDKINEECEFHHFPLMRKGKIRTYTTVALLGERRACVFFGGELAYTITGLNSVFCFDLKERKMAPPVFAKDAYGNVELEE